MDLRIVEELPRGTCTTIPPGRTKVCACLSYKVSIFTERGQGGAWPVVARNDSEVRSVEIAFNAKYLSDALAVIEGEGIKIELTELMRPSHQFDG